MNSLKRFLFISLISIFVLSCSKEVGNPNSKTESNTKELTIFHINDQHGRLENFAKIKYIIDQEKLTSTVMVVCGGDIFSGNPVVDNHDEKGFPMIDLMNKVGFDVAVIGNHEFDYGETILKDRFIQSQFEWVCANVDMNNTGIPQPNEYITIEKGDLSITFLGLIETNGKEDDIIPSTHPWRVKNLTFQKYQDVISNYAQVKENEQSDLFVALTHLGESVDYNIANNYPFFDLIIGGHSHTTANTTVNSIPVFQAGSNLNYLGKIKLIIKDKKVESSTHDLIDLSSYANYDVAISNTVASFNANSTLDDVIGYASVYHSKGSVGSFYTEALRSEMDVDISFQNTGGVRDDLNEGDITKREIYSIDPFNNGSVTYTMTVQEIKNFLIGSKLGIYYSGVIIEQNGTTIDISNMNDQLLDDNTDLTVGVNDYIPAVYDMYFTQIPNNKPFTTAETIINYLGHHSDPIDYTAVNSYFKFQ
jgi:2',3'-cyclic-nucleotide 2'-phosphodiesterase (5'-nucleotidase family)